MWAYSPRAGSKRGRGIKYDTETGRILGYWFADPGGGRSEKYVPAESIIHGPFQTLRPQQLRGISSFAPGVLLAQDLADYMDSEIDGAKMGAKWLAFVTTSNPESWQAGLPTATVGSDQNAKIEEMANTIIEYLRPGEKVELAASNRPGNTFQPFVRLLLTMLSITTGAPYELISGDYQGMNFSTAKLPETILRSSYAPSLSGTSANSVNPPSTRQSTRPSFPAN